jgi:hypothetical protein
VIAALLLIFVNQSALAVRDWNRMDDPLAGAVGFHAGKIGGVGLAYKYPPVWWLNIQVAGGIWHTSDNKYHNFGLIFQYILRQDDKIRLYTAAGVGYFYHKERKEDPLDGREFFSVDKSWNSGVGIGVEWLRSERISFQIEGDFTHESDDGDVLFLPQAGVFFYF